MGVKKSVYIFLCSLLGAMLFLVLHRLLIFAYLILSIYWGFGYGFGATFLQFLAVDYVTLFFALLFGSWYGIWLGSYWYELVYEKGIWRGSLFHVWKKFSRPKKGDYALKEKIERVKERLEIDLSAAENLLQEIPHQAGRRATVKRRVAGKKPGTRKSKTL